jgi:hypothetical protein
VKTLFISILLCFFLSVQSYSQVVDYRAYQSPVRDQGARGTCTAFALLAAFEVFPGFPSDLSEQYLYGMVKTDPSFREEGVDYTEGAFLQLYIENLQLWGTLREDQKPYNPNPTFVDKAETFEEKQKRDMGGISRLELLKTPIFSYRIHEGMYNYTSEGANNVEGIKNVLDSGIKCIPVSYGISLNLWVQHPATREQKIDPADFLMISDGESVYNFEFAKYMFKDNLHTKLDNEELYFVYPDTNYMVNSGHAVAIVGYDENGFLVKNSWGTNHFGTGGYGWISFDYHRLFAAEAMALFYGQVDINRYVEEVKPGTKFNAGDFRLKSLPYKSPYDQKLVTQVLRTSPISLSISIVYHGKTQMPLLSSLIYKVYDANDNLIETNNVYTKGEWIMTGPGNGYEAHILGCDGPNFPSAHKVIAEFTIENGQSFINTYYNIKPKNQEYSPE